MHKVIDSNHLQDERLRRFLQQSARNRAVLPDFLGIEGYNGDLRSHLQWMDILADFPNQVIILKGSALLTRMSGRRSGLVRRLIDEESTKGFPEHITTVKAAQGGNTHALAQVEDLRKDASDHLSKMDKEAADIMPAMEELGRMFTKEERAIIRAGNTYTKDMIGKLTTNLFSVSAMMIGSRSRRRSFDDDIVNTFAFRTALAMFALMMDRTAQGGLSGMKPSKLRNDFVDMIFVAYGTFFDGILTADIRLRKIFDDVCVLLFGLYKGHITEGYDPFNREEF